MRNLSFNICLLFFLLMHRLHAQESIIKFKGQIDAYTGLNFTNPLQTQIGARFLPILSIGKTFKNNLKFDSEISFDSYLNYHFTGWTNDLSGSKIKPYRLSLIHISEPTRLG